MDFTFGIITSGNNDLYIKEIINSIYLQNIPNYEIIIVGNSLLVGHNIRVIPFDETIKNAWITKKKNIINKEAKYDIIVHLHDYIKLEKGWYEGFLKYGKDFDICTTKIENYNGNRFRDYNFFVFELPSLFQNRALLPYIFIPNSKLNKLMYISGAYFVIKKEIALKYPLNEDLCWGYGEDVEFSNRLTNDDIFLKCNPFSKVNFLKLKSQCEWEKEMTHEDLEYLSTLDDEYLDKLALDQRIYLKTWILNTFNITI
jgi:hypothetical protein